MEYNETTTHFEKPESIILNSTAIGALSEARKWTNFFAIMAIIGASFMLLAGLIMMVVLPMFNQTAFGSFPTLAIGIVYILMSLVYIVPIIFLLRFNSYLKKALFSNNEEQMGLALHNLMLHFRTIGIIIISFIVLYIGFIAAMIVFGAQMMGAAGGLNGF